MEKVLTLSTTIKQLENSLLSSAGRNSGECYILVGREGNGKTEILSTLEHRLQEKGFRVFRSKTYSPTEVLKYQPFNEILNQIQSKFINRDSDQIINEMHDYLSRNNDGKTILMVERLEKMSEATRSFFMFISKLSQRFNFTVIGTYSVDNWNKETSAEKFLDIVSSEEHFIIISVQKPTLEDLKYVLRTRGYRLPESFIFDLSRLVNGDINTLSYVLRYYKDQGIINSNKEIDEVTYRFFPIPPTVEIYYEKLLSGIGETALQILDLLAMLGEGMKAEMISELLNIKKEEALDALTCLENSGLVSEDSYVFKIRNTKLLDHVLRKMTSSRKMAISDSVINNRVFSELPVQARLNLLKRNGAYGHIEEILEAEWRSIPEKFTSQSELTEFLESIKPHLNNERTEKIASLLICNSFYYSGKPDEARKCYESDDFSSIDPLRPELNRASIYSSMSNYEEAEKIISTLLSCSTLREDQKAIVLAYRSQNLVMQRKYDEALKVVTETIEISEKSGQKDALSIAYNVMGNIKTETSQFEESMKYYGKSYEINLEMGLRHRMASNLNNIAIINSYLGDFAKSIDILNELIENSYITGDLKSRAYATYNLSEIYNIIGKRDESYYYMPTVTKLVELSRNINLRYQANRFISLFYFQSLDFEKALDAIDEAIEAAKAGGHRNWLDIALAFKGVMLSINGEEIGEDYRKLILKEYDPYDEFSPLYYVIAGNTLILGNNMDGFRKAMDLAEKSAETSGDYYGKLNVIMHKSISLLITRNFDEVREYLKNVPKPDTPIAKYNLIVNFVNDVLDELEGKGKAEIDLNRFMRDDKGTFFEYENFVILSLITLTELLVLKKDSNFNLLKSMFPEKHKAIIENYVSRLRNNGF